VGPGVEWSCQGHARALAGPPQLHLRCVVFIGLPLLVPYVDPSDGGGSIGILIHVWGPDILVNGPLFL
jgi:hypothetical protein